MEYDISSFIYYLKAKYKKLYTAVQPVPYIRDRLYSVDRVFVEGGIKFKEGTFLVPLESYHDVFRNSQSKRRILIGEAGYGKSTLALQFAYDWCNSIQESYLRRVDILILLRLRQLRRVKSIYAAIKTFLLPRKSRLEEHHIKYILQRSPSVLVVLDGFDEYPDAESKPLSDVMEMIENPVFHQLELEVVLTTRYLPQKYAPGTKQLQLTGFDERARDEYVRKAVVGENVTEANKIKLRLQNNPVLRDLCQVPLFFVLYAHITHENEDMKEFKTVTSFFQYILKCFHSHMKNKALDSNVRDYYLYEHDHSKLDKLAYERLSKRNQQIVWNKDSLCNLLGKDFYEQYVRTGILVEEDVDDIRQTNTSSPNQQEVRFYHNIFCEWYAACYMARLASGVMDSEELLGILRYMNPLHVEYCYRFSCGLNKHAAGKIINHVKKTEGGDKFAILCILEQGGLVEDILDTVKNLCSQTNEFKEDGNKLLQRSTVQLLEIASSKSIPISCVRLYSCFDKVGLAGGNHVLLTSGLSIPVLATLVKIEIHENGKSIAVENFLDILQYSGKCLELRELWFYSCLLPESAQHGLPLSLKTRNVKVIWYPRTYNWYRLNLTSGGWERCTEYGEGYGHVTSKDYHRLVEYVKANREQKEERARHSREKKLLFNKVDPK